MLHYESVGNILHARIRAEVNSVRKVLLAVIR